MSLMSGCEDAFRCTIPSLPANYSQLPVSELIDKSKVTKACGEAADGIAAAIPLMLIKSIITIDFMAYCKRLLDTASRNLSHPPFEVRLKID
jgi:hypothetical protein